MRRRDIVTSPSAARRVIVDAPMPRSSSAVTSMPFGAAFNSASASRCRTPSLIGGAFSERADPPAAGTDAASSSIASWPCAVSVATRAVPVSVRRPLEWLGDADQAVALEGEKHRVRAARMTLNRGAGRVRLPCCDRWLRQSIVVRTVSGSLSRLANPSASAWPRSTPRVRVVSHRAR